MVSRFRPGFLILILSLISSISGELASASPLLAARKNVLPRALSPNPLIVVHATRFFDDEAVARQGIDEVVRRAKIQNRSVVYLVSDQSKEGYDDWYTADRVPDYELFSEGGEHNLPIADDEVTIVGGFFGSFDGSRGCHTLATRDAIRMHFEKSNRPLTVHIPLHGTYFWDEDSMVRDELLLTDPRRTPQSKFSEMFDDFAGRFFLTDTQSAEYEFSHHYFGKENRTYRPGLPLTLDRYSFSLLLNERPVSKFGHGPRKVFLRLEN